MNPIARFSAPRAAFPSVEKVCSHLVRLLCLISLFVFSSLSAISSAVTISGCGEAEPAPGRFIVRAERPSVTRVESEALSLIEQLVREKPTRLIHQTPPPINAAALIFATSMAVDKSVVTVATELSVDQISQLQNDSAVLSIEQDCVIHVDALPDDPVPATYLFPRNSLNLARAWDIKTDSSNVIVAVSDTGVDLKHEDLAANLWTNTTELNGKAGIDDDGNGCIDDIHGCDFGDHDGDPTPFLSSEGDHGTHVAGIIGAVGNNSKGVNGVAWKAQLMAVKGFDAGGNALISDLLNTVYYAVNNGARVINCSWGANRAPSQSEIDAFQFALSNGVLPVVAAGNSSLDAAKFSPAGIDGVLAVGSVNSLDQVSGFSNFGSHVAVYAPGGDAVSAGGTTDEFIFSTVPTNHGAYGVMRGTSMAAPFVTGIAALVFSVNPKLAAVDVKQIIVVSSRHVSSKLPNGTVADILIPDADAALKLALIFTPTPFTVSTSPTGNSNFSASPATKITNGPATPAVNSSSTSCALHRSQESAPVILPPLSVLIFFLIPLLTLWTLRAREA